MSFFKTSPVAEMVNRATDELLIGPDWTLNLEIGDLINRQPEQAKEAVKAIRKRIKNKNAKVVLLSLNVLESLMKNCDQNLHAEVGNKDTIADLRKLVGQGNTNDRVVEKMLELILSWGMGFRNRRDLPLFTQTWQQMVREGINFPQESNEKFVPIQTSSLGDPVASTPAAPAPVAARQQQSARGPMQGYPGASGAQPAQYAQPAYPAYPYGVPAPRQQQPTREEMSPVDPAAMAAKLVADLELIRNNVNLLQEMLAYVDPKKEDVRKNELVQEMYKNCKETHPRLTKLIGQVDDEQTMMNLIAVNDEMVRVFTTYDRLAETAQRGGSGNAIAPPSAEDDDSDLLGRAGRTNPAPAPAARPAETMPRVQQADLLGLFGAPTATAPAPVPAPAPATFAATTATSQPWGSPPNNGSYGTTATASTAVPALSPPPPAGSTARPRTTSAGQGQLIGTSPPVTQPLNTSGSIVDLFGMGPAAGTVAAPAPMAPVAAAPVAAAPAPARTQPSVDDFFATLSAPSAPAPAPVQSQIPPMATGFGPATGFGAPAGQPGFGGPAQPGFGAPVQPAPATAVDDFDAFLNARIGK